jgi:hypothetical protein
MEVLLKNKIDTKLFEAYCDLPHFPFFWLVKPDTEAFMRAKDAFFLHGEVPHPLYAACDDYPVDELLIALERFDQQIASLTSNDIVARLYRAKSAELRIRAQLILSIQRRDDTQVTSLSEELFGSPLQGLAHLEDELEHMISNPSKRVAPHKSVDAETFVLMAKETLHHYQMNDWSVCLTATGSVRIGSSRRSHGPTLSIPANLHISADRAVQLLTHEIEVHALRTHHGRKGPLALLGFCLDGYITTEEGLALYYQMKVAKNTSTHLPGFWNSYASALAREMSFTDVFETIFRARTTHSLAHKKDETESDIRNSAWRVTARCHRGIHDLGASGTGFMRDHIYRNGVLQIEKALEEQGEEILPFLFSGNVGINHLADIKKLGLTGTVPDMVSKKIVSSTIKG